MLDNLLTDPNSPARFFAGGAPFYLSGEDHLQVRAFNTANVTLAIVGRVLTVDGRILPFAESFIPSTGGALDTKAVQLTEGWLLNAAVQVSSGTPTASQCLVVLRVVRGLTSVAQSLGTLAQGYATASQEPSWPLTTTTPASGGGSASSSTYRVVTGTDPAAGAQISETVPVGKRWRVMALSAVLTTDATVGNRQVSFLFDDGANVFFGADVVGNQTAGYAQRYNLGDGLTDAVSGAEISRKALPTQMWLPAGSRIRTSVAGFQAGDNWAAPFILIEEV